MISLTLALVTAPLILSDCPVERLPILPIHTGLFAKLSSAQAVNEGAMVRYGCNGTREVRSSTADLTAICLSGQFTPRFSVTDDEVCQCQTSQKLKCRGASYSIKYPEPGSRVATWSINVPSLAHSSVDPSAWSVKVLLDLSPGHFPSSAKSLQANVSLFYNRVEMKSNGQPPGSSLEVSLEMLGPGQIHDWMVPCIKDVICLTPHASVTTVAGSLVISGIVSLLTVLLFGGVMCCKCKAVSNDRRRAAKEQRHPKASVEAPRVVSLIPARHQACRINHPHLYRNVDRQQKEALHSYANAAYQKEVEEGLHSAYAGGSSPFSYNSWERRSSLSGGSRDRQVAENGQQHNRHHHSHHRSKSWERRREDEQRERKDEMNMTQVWRSQVDHHR